MILNGLSATTPFLICNYEYADTYRNQMAPPHPRGQILLREIIGNTHVLSHIHALQRRETSFDDFLFKEVT